LADSQTYSLLYEPNSFRLIIIITQLQKKLSIEKQRQAFQLFVELMIQLEGSLFSVMDFYVPSTKHPILHVCCPVCDYPDPHIKIEHADKISLDLPPLFCTTQRLPKELQPSSYLPFGDSLTLQGFGKLDG